jgi:two-component system LytT family response regulator
MKLTDKIVYKINDELKFIAIEQILFCKSADGCTHIVMTGGKNIFTSKPLKELNAILPEEHFCRIHHTTIVNLSHILGYQIDDQPVVELSDGSLHPVSKRKKAALLSKFTKL